ncbi:MAG TPA: aminotransferase class I/II-fold pyridoxal phosphate-dependent enzyme, partial [Zeimonas sp.]|nr:aminotransferase class I/II-fold pyridoxal phosphate-dependent enzyme [Zeimonas sp.]
LAGTRFRLLDCEGTFFQLVDYSAISERNETDFAKWLTTEVGVAAIPLSAFYERAVENRVVRFCFAKTDATLERALERLGAL